MVGTGLAGIRGAVWLVGDAPALPWRGLRGPIDRPAGEHPALLRALGGVLRPDAVDLLHVLQRQVRHLRRRLPRVHDLADALEAPQPDLAGGHRVMKYQFQSKRAQRHNIRLQLFPSTFR